MSTNLELSAKPDISQLLNNIFDYGSYQTLGNLSITLDGVDDYTNYTRVLDLATGVHSSSWSSNGSSFKTSVFCSHPALSCVYSINSDVALPPVHVSLGNDLMDGGLVNITCGDGFTRLAGITQAAVGLKFDSIARVSANLTTTCSTETGLLTVPRSPQQKSVTIVISAESDYDQTKGNAESNYSFRGVDPGPVVAKRAITAASQGLGTLLRDHIEDYRSLMGQFSLNLPAIANSSDVETADLVARYTNGTADPFLEALMFDYSRHLLISSSREGSLPANLQGRWTEQVDPAWSADYHANINLQMNYWGAEQTGLGALSEPLFEYMTDTWAPRGAETAKLLYNSSGWVVHDEINIFGYTGMKNDAQWANCEFQRSRFYFVKFLDQEQWRSWTKTKTTDPASAAWMMQQVFDHFDYTRNLTWLSETGYPLIKSVALFWLSQLQEDHFYHDGTLVVNPCNSPEQGPTTFGCTHYQQLIHQVFEAALSTAPLASDQEADFSSLVADALAHLDTGIHISTDPDAGTLKEWKVPDSYLYNVYPKHRHLSHLVGWFPGYSISSFADGYSNATIQNAVRASLIARGDGTDTDGNGGNYGWPKVWRGACWARLNDSAQAYEQLQSSVVNNLAPNLLSMYGAKNPPFQIDMNFGWAGNVLSMLVVDLPVAHTRKGAMRTVVLGPAIPSAWGGGSVKGLRIRGGVVVDFEWDQDGVVTRKTVVIGSAISVRFVNVGGEEL